MSNKTDYYNKEFPNSISDVTARAKNRDGKPTFSHSGNAVDKFNNIRTYLQVPYRQRSIAKNCGAFWDPDYECKDKNGEQLKKYDGSLITGAWYYSKRCNGKHFKTVNYTRLDKLFRKEQKKIYYIVDYEDREDAKSCGMRWDAEEKAWYLHENDPDRETCTFTTYGNQGL